MNDAEEVIVRVGEKSFFGVVRREFENGDTQVTSEAAKLFSPAFVSLVFDRKGEAILGGNATVVFPETLAEFAELSRLAEAKTIPPAC